MKTLYAVHHKKELIQSAFENWGMLGSGSAELGAESTLF